MLFYLKEIDFTKSYSQTTHTEEKSKLIRQLKQAKSLVEQLEQDKGMALAEAKRLTHEAIEQKDVEVGFASLVINLALLIRNYFDLMSVNLLLNRMPRSRLIFESTRHCFDPAFAFARTTTNCRFRTLLVQRHQGEEST